MEDVGGARLPTLQNGRGLCVEGLYSQKSGMDCVEFAALRVVVVVKFPAIRNTKLKITAAKGCMQTHNGVLPVDLVARCRSLLTGRGDTEQQQAQEEPQAPNNS